MIIWKPEHMIMMYNFMFLEIFQKLPSGPSKLPSDSCLICVNSQFLRGTA